MTGVHRERLANGLTVLVRRDTSAPVAAVVTYIKAGYFDETDDVGGIAHVLEHMFFKGTAKRGVGDIARQTKAGGGYLNAHTIYDHTSYYAVLPSAGFAAGLEIQADAYANSVIDAEELAREIEVIVQEARRKNDNPSAVATETMYELLHDRHRIRRWRIGHEAGLRALTRADLVRFYRNFYRPGNTILSVVGDVEVDDTLATIDRLYGRLPDAEVQHSPGENEEVRAGFRYREMAGDVQRTRLVLGWRTEGISHPDTPLLDLVAAVLGSGRASRLYRAVRERGFASSVSAYNYTPGETGVFVVQAEADPAQTLGAGRRIWSQIQLLREHGPGLHELERARRLYEAHWLRRLETMDGQAHYLAEWEAAGDWRLGERYLERLLTADPRLVAEAAQRHLSPNDAAVVAYRPAGAEMLAESAAAMRDSLSGGDPERLSPTAPRRATPVSRAGGPAPPELESEEAGVRIYRSASGLPTLTRVKAGTPLTPLGAYMLGGAAHEREAHAGITRLLARAALKGTERRDATQIAEDSELLGATLGGSASGDSFGWSMSVPTRHRAAAVELLADVVQRAIFPHGAHETERQVAQSEIVALRDDMHRYPMRLALDAAYPGHPYGTPVMGTEASLSAIEAGDVRDWHRRVVLNGAGVVALAGDMDPDEAALLLARCFTEIAGGAPTKLAVPEWPVRVTVNAEQRDKSQTALALAFPAPGRRDPERFAVELIANVASGLGGRFFDELRDRQSLAYTVQAHASERLYGGNFVAYIATSPELEDAARDGLLAQFDRLRREPVSDEELSRSQNYAVGTHAIGRQSGGAILGEMTDAWLRGTGLAELDSYERDVRTVTAEQMRDVAERYFDESRRVEGIVRGRGAGAPRLDH